MWLGKKGQYGISQENPQRLKAMRFTCNRIYKLARGKISLRSFAAAVLSGPFTYRRRRRLRLRAYSPNARFHGLKAGKRRGPREVGRASFFHGSQGCQRLGHLFLFKSHQSVLEKPKKRFRHKNPLSCIMFSK